MLQNNTKNVIILILNNINKDINTDNEFDRINIGFDMQKSTNKFVSSLILWLK